MFIIVVLLCNGIKELSYLFSEWILFDLNSMHVLPSTIEEVSNKKLFDALSIILTLKYVCESKLTSVVSQ